MTQPYKVFRVSVRRTARITPHLRSVTFGGPDLAGCVSGGVDQRIKLLFPLPGQTELVLPRTADWYPEYRAMPDDVRPYLRTFTVRDFRPASLELDVEFVLHGDTGPASSWAGRAAPGDRLAIVAPNADHESIQGYEYVQPADTDWTLIAGDETALPAITSIVESLPAGQRALVFIEVDSPLEMRPMASAATVDLTWLSRAGEPGGDVRRLLSAIGGAGLPAGVPYVWLAAESSVATGLRRHLVDERGIDKERIYFSGYWLVGSAIE